jgi:hypothetical protein
MDPRIADYIRANRKKFTRQAITDQLVAAGHDRAEVERTWAALEAPDPDAVAGEGFWGRFALIVIGINVAVLVVIGLLTGALQNAAAGGLIFLVIFAIILGIGALISWGIVAATGPSKLSPTTALVIGIAIPLVVALLLGGSCFALIGGLGGGGSFTPVAPSQPGVLTISVTGAFELDTTVEATCQPFGETPGEGFAISGFTQDSEGRELTVDVSAHLTPGAALDAVVHIGRDPASPERGAFWSEDGPPADVADEAVEFAEGRVEFAELQGFSNETGEATEPLSGEVAWTCG